MSEEVKHEAMEIKGHLFEKFECPVCGERYDTRKEAEDCLNKKPQIHKYNVGDVVLLKHSYYHKGYAVIDDLWWYKEYHKHEPMYEFVGGSDGTTEDEISRLYLTNEQREKLYEKAKSLIPESQIKNSKVAWNINEGTYQIIINVDKDCIND